MQPDRPEGLIATAWLREISRSIYADEFGNALMKDVFEQRGQLVADALGDREGKSRWCDIVTTPKKETCGDLLVPALEAALANLKKRYGADMARWRWGDAHFARSEHRPFARVAPLAKYFDVRVPTGGDTFTVNVGRHQMRNEAEPYANRHAASVRFLHDLSNLENSQFIHSTGQSGHFLSKHYKDWATPWADVQYRPMQMRQENYGKGALGKMTLSPQ
jgi:penicillin G amidase